MKTKRFTQQEEQILKQLVPREEYPPTQSYKSITNKFNSVLHESGIYKNRSMRMIKLHLTVMYSKKKIEWNPNMQKIMLQRIAIGKKWKNIAQQPEFTKNNICAIKIKLKFQSDMRLKFGIIYREAIKIHNCQTLITSKGISDRVFKTIIMGQNSESIRNALNQREMEILLLTKEYFIQSLYQANGKKLPIRSHSSKNQLLKHLQQCNSNPHFIAQTLIKLSNKLKTKPVSRNSSSSQQSEDGDQNGLFQFLVARDSERHQSSVCQISSFPVKTSNSLQSVEQSRLNHGDNIFNFFEDQDIFDIEMPHLLL